MSPPPNVTTGDPAPIDRLLGEGVALHRQGRIAEALGLYQRAITLEPGHLDALRLLGLATLQLGRFAAAVDWYGRALPLAPDDASLPSNRGLALQALGRLEEALASYDQALAIDPGNPDFHFNRGNALREAGRLEDGVAAYDRAIALQPRHVQAHGNRGGALQDLGRAEAAVESFSKAIALAPGVAMLFSNRANALEDLRRWDDAIADYDRAVALDPALAEAQFNRALVLLLTGDLEAGWPAHEWRLRNPKLDGRRRHFPQAPWLGETPLAGRRILLHAEQGLGDTLQFCRYAKRVSDLGAHVLLSAPRPLIGLLRSLEGVDELITDGEPLPTFDRHCPLMSLPFVFKTTLETIPGPAPYLKAAPEDIARWAARLGPARRQRVGLAWSGNPGYQADRDRSIALAQLAAHLPDGLDYFTLQKDIRDADRPALEADGRILDLTSEVGDFANTAALCALMDVVVSVDSSLAHLAGAIGRPTFILLRRASEWRWLLDRGDSPWYSSARLFRQESEGDWDGVLRKVAGALGNLG